MTDFDWPRFLAARLDEAECEAWIERQVDDA